MAAGSDQEPMIDPDAIVEQMRSASERLRDQARNIAAVTAAGWTDVDAMDAAS